MPVDHPQAPHDGLEFLVIGKPKVLALNLSPDESVAAQKRANQLAQDLQRGPVSRQRPVLLHLIKRIVVRTDRIVMKLSRVGLLKQLREGEAAESLAKTNDRTIVLTVPCQFRRRGMEMRLVIGDRSGAEGRPDATLIAALVRAHAWWQELCSGNSRSIKRIADREGSDERYVARNLKLALLAPDITAAILEGRQPADVTADALIKMPDLPYCWAGQRRRLGYASAGA